MCRYICMSLHTGAVLHLGDGIIASLDFVVAHTKRGAGVDCEAHFAASCVAVPGPDSSVGPTPLQSTYSQHTVNIQSSYSQHNNQHLAFSMRNLG